MIEDWTIGESVESHFHEMEISVKTKKILLCLFSFCWNTVPPWSVHVPTGTCRDYKNSSRPRTQLKTTQKRTKWLFSPTELPRKRPSFPSNLLFFCRKKQMMALAKVAFKVNDYPPWVFYVPPGPPWTTRPLKAVSVPTGPWKAPQTYFCPKFTHFEKSSQVSYRLPKWGWVHCTRIHQVP